MIYWITGRANSGKSTLAHQMAQDLRHSGASVLVLDGDHIREFFPTGYSDEDRHEHIIRIAKFAAIAESQDIIVIIALVSPKRIWREEARKILKESKLIYLPGGFLWEGTEYEEPLEDELLEDYSI